MLRYAVPLASACRAPLFGSVRVVMALALSAAAAAAAPEDRRWVTYESERAGLAFQYPEDVFSPLPTDPTEPLKDRTDDRAGRAFISRDGRATLQIATFPNLDNMSVGALRTQAIAASYKDATVEYNRLAPNWYVLSGTRGPETFYERTHFSCEGRRLDVWTVTYPTAEAKFYDELVDEMARRFRTQLASIRCR
jgi:hypothetical protein